MATLGGYVPSLPEDLRKIKPVDTKATEAVTDLEKLLHERLLEDMPTADEIGLWMEALNSMIPRKKLKTKRDEFFAFWWWILFPNYAIERAWEPMPKMEWRSTVRG